MKAWWNRQCSRIDTLALRERLLLWVVALVCCLAAADTFWLSPAQTAHRKLATELSRENAELETMRAQLQAHGQATSGLDPIVAAREQIARTRALIEQINRDIVEASNLSDQSNTLPKVLVQFLRKHERLTLVRTATLAGDLSGARGLAPTTAERSAASVRRQGLELTVSGPYLELMNYVRTLEQALPTLRWGNMKLSSEKQPPQLTLQVYLVGVQP